MIILFCLFTWNIYIVRSNNFLQPIGLTYGAFGKELYEQVNELFDEIMLILKSLIGKWVLELR